MLELILSLVIITACITSTAFCGTAVYQTWQEIRINRDHLLMHQQAKTIANGVIREIERRDRSDT